MEAIPERPHRPAPGECICIHVLRRVGPAEWSGTTRLTDPECEVHR